MHNKYCTLVWDRGVFRVPQEMGSPRDDQINSTPLDNLVELAGRVCYDSLGKGRSTEDYHKHIIEVNHGSVWEHGNITFKSHVGIDGTRFLNRPGIYWNNDRFTLNLRAIREWDQFTAQSESDRDKTVGDTLKWLAKTVAPLVMGDLETEGRLLDIDIVEPESEEEIWLSFFITNVSRGFSHELVRHKYRTAVSQRSTRYVDESESKWCWHPLFQKYFDNNKDGHHIVSYLESSCQKSYKDIVNELQDILIKEGVDKFTARKQSRGAARGILGNALMTELIFSASLTQWKAMLRQRASEAADAEIRLVFNEIFDILATKYPNQFKNWIKKPCKDGIGFAVEEQKGS